MKGLSLFFGLLAVHTWLAAENYVETVAGTGLAELNIQKGSVKDFNIADPFALNLVQTGECMSRKWATIG